MQDFINTFLKIIKYPLALLSAFLCIPIVESLIHFIASSFHSHLIIYFVLPVIGMVVLWSIIPGLAGSCLTIFGHEATHMLAAILTFHKPTGIRIEQDKGGSFSYIGTGNWFITTAPYFIPLFPLLWMLLTLFFTTEQIVSDWYLITFGILVGFHIAANFTQIHAEQTDFKKAGWLFSFLFLPGVNALILGYLWSFSIHNWSGFSLWTAAYTPSCQDFIQKVWHLIFQ